MEEAVDITLEDMVSQLGGSPPSDEPAADTETDPAPEAETEPVADAATTEEPATEEADKAPEDKTSKPKNVDTKAQEAFVYMRQQNKRMVNALKGVADVLGLENVDINDENKLLEAVQQKITANQAEKQNIPVEFLEEFQSLKAKEIQATARQREHETAVGLQSLQSKYSLTQTELNDYVKELISSGINPLQQSVNLVQEYQSRHFDGIVTKEVEKAVAAEQQRSSKAATHSSNPGNKTGARGSVGDTGKVENVRELEAWLKSNGNN